MTEQNQDGTQRIFISEVQRHQARYRKLIQFTHSSTKAAGAMLLAAVVALIVANTGAYEAFLEFWHTEAGFFFGDAFAGMSLAHVINDIFMAVFFLLVGLEVKYELTVGELTNIRQALLPIMAAIGGNNSNSLLPYLEYEGLCKDPKIIVGYSDVTALLLGIYAQTGLTTYYGPAVVASFGEFPPFVDETYTVDRRIYRLEFPGQSQERARQCAGDAAPGSRDRHAHRRESEHHAGDLGHKIFSGDHGRNDPDDRRFPQGRGHGGAELFTAEMRRHF